MSSKVIIEGAGFLPVVQVDSLVRTSLRLCGTLPVLLPAAAAAELPVPDLALELLVDVVRQAVRPPLLRVRRDAAAAVARLAVAGPGAGVRGVGPHLGTQIFIDIQIFFLIFSRCGMRSPPRRRGLP